LGDNVISQLQLPDSVWGQKGARDGTDFACKIMISNKEKDIATGREEESGKLPEGGKGGGEWEIARGREGRRKVGNCQEGREEESKKLPGRKGGGEWEIARKEGRRRVRNCQDGREEESEKLPKRGKRGEGKVG
jgi:hypothetical protein